MSAFDPKRTALGLLLTPSRVPALIATIPCLSFGGDMRRREFITLLGATATWPLAAQAQQPATPVIGFLSGRSLKSDGHLVEAFRQGLNDVGYIDGQNVAIEYRWADGQFDRLLELATDLVRKNAVVLFAGAVDVKIKEIKAAISKLPIVFATGSDLVELGVVASMNRPGGKATGVTVRSGELWPKQLELLRKLAGLRPPRRQSNAPSATPGP